MASDASESSRAPQHRDVAWTRWQDWAAVFIGAYLVLAPIWVETNGFAMTTMIGLGSLLAIVGMWSLAMPGSMVSEYSHVLVGALVFIAPWVMGYSEMEGAAWTSWVVGLLAIVAGTAALPKANQAGGGSGVAGQH